MTFTINIKTIERNIKIHFTKEWNKWIKNLKRISFINGAINLSLGSWQLGQRGEIYNHLVLIVG